MIMVPFTTGSAEDIFSFDADVIRSDVHVQQWYAFLGAKGTTLQGCQAVALQTESECIKDANCEWEESSRRGQDTSACVDKVLCPGPEPLPRQEVMDIFMFVYEAKNKDKNLLDDSMLEYVREFEQKMFTDANGADKPWTDFCFMTYPTGTYMTTAGLPSAVGSCASPLSFITPYTMTPASRAKVGEQINNGYTFSPPGMSCICSATESACSICNNGGTAKPLSSWPTSISTCMSSASAAATPPPTVANASASCNKDGFSVPIGAVMDWFCSNAARRASCQFEAPSLSSFCSSTGYYFPTDNDNSMLKGSERDAVTAKMCDANNDPWVNFRTSQFGVNVDCAAKKATYARTIFLAGHEKGGGTDAQKEEEQEAFKNDYLSPRGGWLEKATELEAEIEKRSKDDGNEIRIMVFALPLFFNQILAVLYQDMCLSIGALIVVWLYIWWVVESLFLATCGIFEILFSLPVAMSIWVVICQQKLSSLQPLVVYMILGIGADDVFLVYDSWQQASYTKGVGQMDTRSRFAWAYRRSFAAMLVTTATTCGSFAIGCSSPLPSVRGFSIFAAITVFVDWIFCVTFFSAALMVHGRFFEGYGCCGKCVGTKAGPPGQCTGPGCCWGCLRMLLSQGGQTWSITSKPAGAGEEPQPRFIEKFCTGPLYRFLCGWGGKVMVAFWTVLVIVFLSLTCALVRTAEKAPPIGQEWIDSTRVVDVLITEYPSYDQPKTYGVWGLESEAAMEEWASLSKTSDMKASFSGGDSGIESESGQMAVLNLCRSADTGKSGNARCSSKDCLVKGSGAAERCARDEQLWKRYGVYATSDSNCATGRYCFMEEVARFWAFSEGSCSSYTAQLSCDAAALCQWATTEKTCYSIKTEDDYVGLPRAEFLSLLSGQPFKQYLERRGSLLEGSGRGHDAALYQEMTGYALDAGKTRINFAFVGFNATYSEQNTAEDANNLYDQWQAFFDKHKTSPAGYQTTKLYVFRATQNEMIKGAIMGVFLSLIVALVVLVLTTANWWTSLMGIGNIIAVVIMLLGFFPIFGWSLGENECIFMIAAVGLSVDYTVHLLHAYNHADSEVRKEKARMALGEMGISVISSAITTLGAAALLFFCGFWFFFQFGAFIFTVISLSIVMSLTFLMPLLILIGPQYEQGKIPCPWKKSHKGSTVNAVVNETPAP
jgi:hypothetical protein